MKRRFLLALCACTFVCAISGHRSLAATAPKDATPATVEAYKTMIEGLDFLDSQDFEDAKRGFIAPLGEAEKIPAKNGGYAWDVTRYSFLLDKDGKPSPAPATVNPSLWRQSRLIMIGGLFKVCDRIYQVRNADISNMTIIEGDSGIIIADPLISAENAAAALKLYYAHRPHKPVIAVIYSHSHVDHYGGVLGVTSPADVKAGKVRIIAPEGFMEATASENVIAGTAMARRAQYMYGSLLAPSPRGHVGSGLGLRTSDGFTSVIPPTDSIQHDGDSLSLDGLTFQFLLAPNTEAPSEMHWYIPELKALTAAENCTHTMHNLYTLRGAKARDPLAWVRALEATDERYGKDAQVLYGMHHWPVWGNARVRELLQKTADLYRFINDQTLRLANQGETMLEIAEHFRLPKELNRVFALRGYYGSLSHDVKAVYNFYLGWFDGNPAHLHVLTPVDAAKRYVEYMGGAEAVLKRARRDFEKGEYRWVAQVVDHVVFANPANREARELEADALEQLGYQAESGPWRNFYLSGAQDLRGYEPGIGVHKTSGQEAAMPPELYFAKLGIRLDGPKAEGREMRFTVDFSDFKEKWLLHLKNGVLHARKINDAAVADGKPVDFAIAASFEQVFAAFDGRKPGEAAVITGDREKFNTFRSLLVRFDGRFALVEP